MKLSLNTNKEILWQLPGTPISLSSSTPSIEVDIKTLDERTRWAISTAVRLGKLTSDISPEEIFRSVEQSAPAPVKVQKVAEVRSSPDTVAARAKEMLELPISSIKKEVLISKDLRLLKMMLALEGGNKKRTTVVKLLTDKISKEEESVKAAISIESEPIIMADPSMTMLRGKRINYDVVESDITTVNVEKPGKSK